MKLTEKNLVRETWNEVSPYPLRNIADEQNRFFKVQLDVEPYMSAFTAEYGEKFPFLLNIWPKLSFEYLRVILEWESRSLREGYGKLV